MSAQLRAFKKFNFGFTMLELVVTLLIVGILAAVSVPIYNSYVNRARMAEGIVGVDAFAKAEILYYQNKKTFTTVSIGAPQSPTWINTVPSGGSKYTVGEHWASAGARRDYEKLLPFASGSQLGFAFSTMAVKLDSTGAAIANGDTYYVPDGGWGIVTSSRAIGVDNLPVGFGSQLCSPSGPSLCDSIKNMGAPDRSGVCITALANFNNSSQDIRLRDGSSSGTNAPNCSFIYKPLYTNDQGKVVNGPPVARSGSSDANGAPTPFGA